MRSPTVSAILSKSSVIWLFGVIVMAHEIFLVPPNQLRVVPLLLGAVMEQVSGLELARALWNGGGSPDAPSLPLPTSPPVDSPSATPSSGA